MSAVGADELQGPVQLTVDHYSAAVIRAWNLCGGEYRIGDMEALADLVGADDVEVLLHALGAIRQYCHQKSRGS